MNGTPLKSSPPTAGHLALRNALETTLRQHVGTLSAVELLAVLSHLVGQVIAMQDQRTMTSAMVMDLVSSNIQQGNAEVLGRLLSETGGSA